MTASESRLVTPTPAIATSLDSPAQAAVRQLAKPSGDARPLRVANAERVHPDLVTRLEEIRIYGRNEPEDYVGRRLSPLMKFRARLEKDLPMTPAKKLQLALCIIGLCGIYGPEGVHFYTRLKTVTARWPAGIKSGAEFSFPSQK